MGPTNRTLVATPLLRHYGAALTAMHRMIAATPWPVEVLLIHGDQPCDDGNQNVLHNYEVARRRFLAGDYTHLLTLEDDMVPPEDALVRLSEVGAPVAYALYCWRRPPYHWSAYRAVNPTDGVSWSDHNPWQAQRMAQEQAIIDVAGVGLGCTLIDRATVERIPFRCPQGAGGANDWHFAMDCQAAGIRQAAHLGVRVGHIMHAPSYRIIWPDPDTDGQSVACKRLYRMELL